MAIIQINPFEGYDLSVTIDWEYALTIIENIDKIANRENNHLIEGRAVIKILAEYGVTAYKAASVPENTKLAIIISLPYVYFCPSTEGLDGVFIEQYNPEKHGRCLLELRRKQLFDCSNIQAKVDGWDFFSAMVSR